MSVSKKSTQQSEEASSLPSSVDNGAESSGIPFFELGGRYLIDPATDLRALLNDFQCLFNSGLGILDDADKDNHTDAQWAAIYMLRQAGAVYREASRRVWDLLHAEETL